MKKILFAVVLSAFFFACSTSKKAMEIEDTSAAVACADISYTNTIKALLDAKCAKCHTGPNAKHGVELSSYEGASQVDSKELTCVISWKEDSGCKNMPPFGGQLTAEQISQITCWANNGHKK